MPDYLSRSPVDEAEEDSDEFIPTGTKATQTDELTFYGQHNLTIVAAVQTRSVKNQQNITNSVTPELSFGKIRASDDSREDNGNHADQLYQEILLFQWIIYKYGATAYK
ncbi:unnamed protein product [Didymodactylos carnosus]|uniref:Uncharacterized protein n=1 Tax=Didymodactylos carnosus TaxID=1234261 RepID=A0A8S2CTV1_9BILA|nr:unnamed protein product [Didymodactylos carnosus]CAF3513608.1 unnamed protein product [Didymodactylos carnosus]